MLRRGRALAFVALIAMLTVPVLAYASDPTTDGVEFNRDVRPILSETCFACHGPDQAKRKAKLRLDTEAGATADLGGRHAIVAGDVERSELLKRISAADAEERMPPLKSGRKLTEAQIQILRRWVEQGAQWQPHWSLISPKRPAPPALVDSAWVRNPIDAFVRAHLDREGLLPSSEADPETLLRRVTLDLTGLPPSANELEAFLSDRSPDAYARVVDRLLASPRYGERMATRWLDAARYADTNGYQSDGERIMWRWRDWVIDAFNRNMPFDQFTIEQLAGDLLPRPTLDQKIATAFHRNHRGNAEGGIIPEEYEVEYVVDRVDTTATVWLGLTLGCARCHDHKFDPIRQKDYYGVFAFFNNIPEKGRAVKFGNSPPMIKSPTPAQQDALRVIDANLADAESRDAALRPELAKTLAAWERSPPDEHVGARSEIVEGLAAHFALDGDARDRFAPNAAPKIDEAEYSFRPGRLGKALACDGGRVVEAQQVGEFGFDDRFSLGAWIAADGDAGGTIVSRMIDKPQAEGYSVALVNGRIQASFVKRWLDDALRVESAEPVSRDGWHHVMVTYDGTRLADGVKLYVDGRSVPTRVLLDELNQTFKSTEPFRIGGGGGPDAQIHGLVDDVRVYARALSADEVELVATPETIEEIRALEPDARSERQTRKLLAYYVEQRAPERIRAAHRRVRALRAERDRLIEGFPTTMVMEERLTPRDAHVLVRGQYDRPGEKVERAVPACLPPLPATTEQNRLGLARWLVEPDNPLTARVAVNRTWQKFFGTGLVKTLDDFGAQGEWPKQAELLDWLATEFVRTGWDVKEMDRLIVMSATYRQSSRVSPDQLRRDPENRLLGRGPRARLSAEMIRDQALALSGLLAERLGGPSVRPYQPDGLWKELAEIKDYQQDHGPNLYRRGLYTFWKRTVAPPSLMLFDASGREACTVRESRTNTPLQALTLLNDVTYVEAARVLAERAMHEGGATPEARLGFVFRLAVARSPTEAEQHVLVAGYGEHLNRFRAAPEAARVLAHTGEAPRDETLDVAEHAAYTAMTSLILNLDEVITKE
jgi:hypothetical protein